MNKKELLNAKKVLLGLSLAALASTCVIENNNKKDDRVLYIYEKDENGIYLEPKKIKYDENLTDNTLFDDYNGKDIKVMDINDDYIIEKDSTNNDEVKSYIYFNDATSATIMNSNENHFYNVINYADSEYKLRKSR